MSKKLKIHDGDAPGKVFEVKIEYPKPTVTTMSNLKCPFCQQEMICGGTICHYNPDCPIHDEPVPTEVLELLGRTRKALDVAVDALERIDKQLMTGIEMTSQARNALEQITATLENKNGNC